jgi:hypothetical protein
MPLPPSRLSVPLLLCALAGCAASGTYPSLAPRPQELARRQPPPQAEPPAPAPADPAVAARIAELIGEARNGQSEFEKALAETRPIVSRAGAAGSESWIDAQQAVSRLEGSRGKSVAALAALDALGREKTEAGAAPDSADLAAIAAAENDVRALVEAQDAQIKALSGSLRAL